LSPFFFFTTTVSPRFPRHPFPCGRGDSLLTCSHWVLGQFFPPHRPFSLSPGSFRVTSHFLPPPPPPPHVPLGSPGVRWRRPLFAIFPLKSALGSNISFNYLRFFFFTPDRPCQVRGSGSCIRINSSVLTLVNFNFMSFSLFGTILSFLFPTFWRGPLYDPHVDFPASPRIPWLLFPYEFVPRDSLPSLLFPGVFFFSSSCDECPPNFLFRFFRVF